MKGGPKTKVKLWISLIRPPNYTKKTWSRSSHCFKYNSEVLKIGWFFFFLFYDQTMGFCLPLGFLFSFPIKERSNPVSFHFSLVCKVGSLNWGDMRRRWSFEVGETLRWGKEKAALVGKVLGYYTLCERGSGKTVQMWFWTWVCSKSTKSRQVEESPFFKSPVI